MASRRPSPLSKATQADRRIAERYEVCVGAEVKTMDGVPLSAEVTNISVSGFRARSPMMVRVGSTVLVRYDRRFRRAKVVWHRDGEIGCSFLRTLSIRDLEEAALAGTLRGHLE